MRVFNGSQAKLPMQPEYLRLITEHTPLNLDDVDDVRELLDENLIVQHVEVHARCLPVSRATPRYRCSQRRQSGPRRKDAIYGRITP